MTEFGIEVRITPRRGILDPQGQAVAGALAALGFEGIEDVHVGRIIQFTLTAPAGEEARARVDAMCRQLLANPVTEDFDVVIVEHAGAAR